MLAGEGEVAAQSGPSAMLFSSRRNWDSPNPSFAGEVPPPRVWGEGHTRWREAREGLGESQFRRGDVHCGTLYIYVLCGLQPFVRVNIR